MYTNIQLLQLFMLKRKDYVYFSFTKLEYCIHNISGNDTVNWHEIYFCSLRNMERAIKWSSLWSEVCNLSNNLVFRIAIIIVSKCIQKIIELCIIIALMLIFLSFFCGYRNTNVLILLLNFKGLKPGIEIPMAFRICLIFEHCVQASSCLSLNPAWYHNPCSYGNTVTESVDYLYQLFINSKLELYFPIFLSSLPPSFCFLLTWFLCFFFYFVFLSLILILCTLWFCMQELGRFVVLV